MFVRGDLPTENGFIALLRVVSTGDVSTQVVRFD